MKNALLAEHLVNGDEPKAFGLMALDDLRQNNQGLCAAVIEQNKAAAADAAGACRRDAGCRQS